MSKKTGVGARGGSRQFQQCPKISWFFFVLIPSLIGVCALGKINPTVFVLVIVAHYIQQTNWFIDSSFSSQSSRHHKSQIIRARELKCWEIVNPPLCVTCHMSHVMCHMSSVRWQVSGVKCHSFLVCVDKMVELVGGGSLINGAYPVYIKVYFVMTT